MTGERARRSSPTSRRYGPAARFVALSAIAATVLVPVYFTALVAVLPVRYLFSYPPVLLPHNPHLDGFRAALRDGFILHDMLNSLVVAVIVTVGQATTSALASYACVFLRFPGRRIVFWTIVASSVVPFEAVILGNYRTIVWLHWLDSYPALTVPFLASGVGTFFLSRAFRSVPVELLGAAHIDGAGHMAVLRHVVVPIARPSIAALGVLSFLGSWTQYFWPKLVVNENSRRTVQMGLAQLASGSVSSANVLSAAAILLLVPVVLVLVLFQRQLVAGLTAGLVER